MISAGLWRWLGLERLRWTGALLLSLLPAVFGQPLWAADSGAATTNTDAALVTTLHSRLGVGSWIWDRTTHDRQECRLWESFKIPVAATVERARLRITADNGYRLFLDGREVGHGSDLRMLTTYDITPLLASGVHVLGVIAYNDLDIAGVLLGLRVELTDGRIIEVGSDATWRVVPEGERGWLKKTRASASWPPATVIAAVGQGRWPDRFNNYSVPPPLPLRIPAWQSAWFQITLALVCAAAIATSLYLVGRLVMQSQSQQVVRRERARIARDIHDDLSGGLTQLVLLGETTQSGLPPESEVRRHLNEICERARVLLRGLNETIWVVNSQRDTLRDFASYVCKHAETFLQSMPIRCRFDVEPDLPPIPCDVGIRRNLFLAVKEALNNVVRHSGASEVFIRIHREGLRVMVCIEDDGRGFDPGSADRERNGLQNMVKRAAEAGGECSIMSMPGTGCRVQFSVPLAGSRRYPLRWFGRSAECPPIQPAPPPVARSGTAAPSSEVAP
jgi:signal transduction histidine kinase